MPARAGEQRGVERGHQRRALAAGGHVAGTKIGDHGQARALGHPRGVVDLQRPAFRRAVAQRLAVDAGSQNIGGGDAGMDKRGADRLRVEVGQDVGRARGPRELVVAGGLQREELGAQRRRERPVRGTRHGARTIVEGRDNGVDAVEARAGHHADAEVARHAWLPSGGRATRRTRAAIRRRSGRA